MSMSEHKTTSWTSGLFTGFIGLGCIAFSLNFSGPLYAEAATDTLPELTAKWIWTPQESYQTYNQTVMLSKNAKLPNYEWAKMYITADSWYRLKINDVWVADGPCRAWPEHYQYDILDVGEYLVPNAENTITITAKYFGIGTFHVLPRQAGALAQLEMDDPANPEGSRTVLITDNSWIASELHEWTPNTPKASIQMEGSEWYDARLERTGRFNRAAELYNAYEGPWKDLQPRDTALLSRTPMFFKRFVSAKVVRSEGLNFCIQPSSLNYPGFIEANHTTSLAGGMASILENAEPTEINLSTGDIRGQEGMRMNLDGKPVNGKVKLDAGKHLLVCFSAGVTGHDKEKSVRFLGKTDNFKLVNLLDSSYENPWTYIHFPESYFSTNDYSGGSSEINEKISTYHKNIDLLGKIASIEEFTKTAGKRLKNYPSKQMLLNDFYWQFCMAETIDNNAIKNVKNPSALIHNNAQVTTVYPDKRGDMQLLYDLGEQSCGYYTFRLKAPAGTVVDLTQIEYIKNDGTVQIARENRNGMRYITKDGLNEMTSIKRRSGRYVYLTLRNMTAPVEIQNLHLIESTYPVDYKGSFDCSDARLSRIWDISTRTLKLCMEDTYTDCPLYEQTHWVGDARNESLFGYGVFGAEDIGKRCIKITAESLEHYPFAGCQTPSCWDTLIPVWSLMWGISMRDYYWETGDKEFAKQYLPYAVKNLRNMAGYINKDGLFSGPFWNMFDWSGADQGRQTVVHNSMFMVGAIDAALVLSDAIGGSEDDEWLKTTRASLVKAINKLWNPKKKAYPDSVYDNGEISPSTCQHTSFLSLLFDIVEPENRQAAINNVLNPPQGMVQIGSAFAVLYMYEALEKIGMEDVIIQEVYNKYLPMLEIGSTTVWESYPGGTTIAAFPTRSHCHAWSSAPSRYLPRIILGLKTTSAGAKSVEISPRVYDLQWAEGSIATTRGTVKAYWKINGKTLDINCTVPEGTELTFKANPSHDQFETVTLNGKKVK